MDQTCYFTKCQPLHPLLIAALLQSTMKEQLNHVWLQPQDPRTSRTQPFAVVMPDNFSIVVDDYNYRFYIQ